MVIGPGWSWSRGGMVQLGLAGALCLLSAVLWGGDFSIKHPNGYVNKSVKAFWDDHVVDPANSSGCWVEVTEDKGGLISGRYHVDVAYPIGKEPRMSLSGEFSRIEKFKE